MMGKFTIEVCRRYPQQPNHYDCGVYTAESILQFLSNPCNYPTFTIDKEFCIKQRKEMKEFCEHQIAGNNVDDYFNTKKNPATKSSTSTRRSTSKT
jgi:Ulp1 family protease